jgi:hypothetical protein
VAGRIYVARLLSSTGQDQAPGLTPIVVLDFGWPDAAAVALDGLMEAMASDAGVGLGGCRLELTDEETGQRRHWYHRGGV